MKLFYLIVTTAFSASVCMDAAAQDCGGGCVNDARDALGIKTANMVEQTPYYREHLEVTSKMDAKAIKDDVQRVFACAGANMFSDACLGDISNLEKSNKVIEYAAYLKAAQDTNVEQYKAIEDFDRDTYVREYDLDGEAKDVFKNVIDDYKDLAKAQADLANFENAEKRAVFLTKQEEYIASTAGAEKKRELEKNLRNAQAKLRGSLNSVEDIPQEDADDFMDALDAAKDDLMVSVTEVKPDDIYNSLPQLEKCKDPTETDPKVVQYCREMAGKYLASVISGNQPITVYRQGDENCDIIDRSGDAIRVAMGFIGASQSLKFQECADLYGLSDPQCIKIGTRLNNFFGDPYGLAKSTYYDTTSEQSLGNYKVTPHFITSGSGSPTDLGFGGTYPVNAYSPTATGVGGTGLGSMTGANNRINSETAANIYNNMSKDYTAMGTGAGSINSKYSGYPNQVKNYNDQLDSAISSITDPAFFQNRANSVQGVMDKIAGGSRTSEVVDNTSTIAIRQKITQLNAEKSQLVQDLANRLAKGSSSKFNLKWGSLNERREAAAYLATGDMYLEMTKAKIAVIDREISLYYRNVRTYTNSYAQGFFDIAYMYASNGNTIGAKRALSLKELKTPVKGRLTLKPGWQNEFKKYIVEMKTKADESKKKMNLAKTRMQKMLSERFELVKLSKLPSPERISYEIRNMNSIEAAARKNMANIEKAMQYHKSRRENTPAKIYAQYENEAKVLKSSMQNVVNSIDGSKDNINKSYVLVNSIYSEVSRAEALRKVAKQMVEQGL